ncbi:MAG: diguanylate cyclase [Coriobacteriia bacterium]|nr:diguanylate cyclase [Coriobacteriia bacterium]
MREILEECIRVDRTAARLYRSMAERCDDPAVADVLGKMAQDETAHVGWWRELAESHERGLLPDLYDDTEDVRERIRETLDAVKSAVPAEGRLSGSDALAAAAAMELFLADQCFIELLDFSGAGAADERHDAYDRHVRRLVTAIGEHGEGGIERLLGMQLRRAWHEARALARDATRDPLTGLGNRLWLEANARTWAAWSGRSGRPFALILLDLDRFREINEVHGRAAGDATLLAVGEVLRAAVRQCDYPARYGSDEFAVIAPEAGPDEARTMAHRIAHDVRGALVASEAGLVNPTVSVGIAVVMDPPSSPERTLEELILSADRSLYAAKRSGRDRIAEPVILASALPVG